MSSDRYTQLIVLALLGLALTAGADDPGPAASEVYETKAASGSGIGKVYMGREIANVMSHRQMARLDRPERDREERTDLLVAGLPLEKDNVVADIGAGSGYFTFRVAERVPDGEVIAVDIQQEMLDEIERRKAARNIDNVRSLLGEIDDPRLAPQSVDLVFIVDAYHEFSHPREMGEAIYRSLRPGRFFVVVEDRAEDDGGGWGLHQMTEAQVRKEITALGFEWLRTETFLPEQHFLVFRKPLPAR